MQATVNGTVAKSLPQNKVILLTFLISNKCICYTDSYKIMLLISIAPMWKQKSFVK